jgi:hypothetical protein
MPASGVDGLAGELGDPILDVDLDRQGHAWHRDTAGVDLRLPFADHRPLCGPVVGQ